MWLIRIFLRFKAKMLKSFRRTKACRFSKTPVRAPKELEPEEEETLLLSFATEDLSLFTAQRVAPRRRFIDRLRWLGPTASDRCALGLVESRRAPNRGLRDVLGQKERRVDCEVGPQAYKVHIGTAVRSGLALQQHPERLEEVASSFG